MAGIKKIELASANGPVTVEIVIGQAQFGRYELALYDTEGKNPVVIARFANHRASCALRASRTFVEPPPLLSLKTLGKDAFSVQQRASARL